METKEMVKNEYGTDHDFSYHKKTRARYVDKRKAVIIGILLCAMLLSILAAPFVIGKSHIIDKAETVLDSKKDAVVAVTTAAATISVAVAAIPGDSTTPLANQIASFDIFFIIVLTAIYLLKVLLVVSVSLSFKILLPAACLLFIIHLLSGRSDFKNIAVKLFIFALVVFFTVPVSVAAMNVVDTVLKTQEKVAVIAAENETDSLAENGSEDVGLWGYVTGKAKDAADYVVNAAKEMYQKAKDQFSKLVDIVASLVITCCVIPLIVIVFLAWILKILFGINMTAKNGYFSGRMPQPFGKRTKNTDLGDNAEI